MKLKKFFGGFTELIQQKHQMCAQNEDMTKFKCIHIANNIIITRLGVYFQKRDLLRVHESAVVMHNVIIHTPLTQSVRPSVGASIRLFVMCVCCKHVDLFLNCNKYSPIKNANVSVCHFNIERSMLVHAYMVMSELKKLHFRNAFVCFTCGMMVCQFCFSFDV